MIDAKEAKIMMKHRDDIIFGVIERCEHEIMAAALKGDSGFLFHFPKEYLGYAETALFFNSLVNRGFTVTEGEEGYDGEEVIGIYWNI